MAFETGIIPGELQPNYFNEPNLPTPPETGILDLLPQTPAMPNFNPQYQAAGSGQVEDPIKQGLKNFALSPASANTLAAPTTFDWERSQADRYVNARQYKQLGFNPNIGQENEYLYGATQTWGDVWSNGFTGMFKLAGNTFIEGWKGWANLVDAIGSTSWSEAKQDLIGTPEELLEQDKLTKEIMNKYAIFETPDSQKGVFNKSFFGTMLQQSGFAVGTIGQFLSEELLTMGMSSAFSLSKLGIKGASWMGKIVKMEEVAKDMKRLGDSVWRSRTLAEGLVQGARKFIPLADTVYDMRKFGKAGAGALQITAIGVGGVRRTLAEANMAFTEARMEAAGTYGELYNKLYDEELFKTGQAPSALSLERIKENSMLAAQDNFSVNSGILMVMNRIQFDNLFSKFKFGRSVLGEAGGFADDVIKVTGKRIGKEAGEQLTKTYTKGALGTLSTIGKISADFGGRKAAWEATKAIGKNVFKWEASEGIQELLQEGSNVALQDYYYDLYHGYKGGFEKSVSKAVDSQANIQGLKTFLMGALTGRLLSPMNFAIGKAKLYAGTDAKQRAERKVSIQDAVKQVNAFYENPNKYLPEHIANIKVQNKAAQNMEEAIANRDEYVFHNNKDSAFAKMISSSIKLGMFESTLDTLKGYGETFDEKDFKEAFGMELTDANRTSVNEFFTKIANEATEFHKNWKTLKERYGDLVKPEIYKEGSDEHQMSLVAKRALDDALEILATNDHKARRNVIRAVGLQQKMSGIPVIGGSAAIAFRNLGVIENTEKELELLENEIKELDAIPKKDKVAKDRLKIKKQQLKALQNWKENHAALKGMGRKDKRNFKKAMKAFENYMNSKNLESEIDVTIKQDDLEDIYKNLIDYIELNNDNKEYVDAYNILANPMQFVNIHKRLMDAMEHTKLTKLAEHLQEMINEAQGKPPVKEDQPGAIAKHIVRPEQDGTFSVLSPKGTVVGKDLKTLEDAQVIADTLDEALEKKKKAAETPGNTPGFVPPGLSPNAKVSLTSNDIFLIEETDPASNETVYYIVNKEGDFIKDITLDSESFPTYESETIYTDYNSAKEIFDALVKQSTEDNAEFEFDGFKLKTGTILLDGKNRRFKVLSKGGPKKIQGKSMISIVNISNNTSKPENIGSLKGFRLESQAETVTETENPNAFRLVRNNELLRIYPHVNKQIGETRLEAEKRLQELLLNTPASILAAGISIVVTKNAQVSDSRFAADAEGNNENKRLRVNGEQYSLALVYQGQTIGYMPNYKQYSYVDKAGNATDMDMITKTQFQEIFNVGKDSNLDREFTFFKQNYAKSRAVYTAIMNELKPGETSVTLTPDIVNTLFTVNTTTGDYAYVKKGEEAPSLKDLKHNTIDGYTYIIDRRTRHLGDMMYADDEIIRTNAPKAKKEAIDKKVQAARFREDGTDVLANQGRYVAVIGLPNGKIRFVELSSYNISKEDLNTLVEDFNNRSKKLKEENLQDAVDEKTKQSYKEAKDPSAANDINSQISETIYITFPGVRGMAINLMLTPMGDIKVEFARFIHGNKKPEKAIIVLRESDKDATKPLALKDINDLLDRINRAVDAYDAKPAKNVTGVLNNIRPKGNNFKLSVDNFIRSISESFSPDEYTNLRTNTTVNVVQNTGLTITRKPSEADPANSTVTKNVQGAGKKTNVPGEEDLEGIILPDDVDDAQQELIKQRMAEIAKRNQEKQAELDRIEREKKERAGKKDVVDQVADLQKQRADIVYELEGQLLNQKDENGNALYTRKQIRTNPIFKTDPRIIAIDQQIAELNDPNNAALKVSSNLSEENVNDINEFRQWMQEHLPEFISVEDMQVLSEKMKEQGVTVGMFYMQLDKINNVLSGKVAVTKTTAWKYHEAFHGVFRMLLTDEKIDQLLNIARKELLQQGKSISALKKELLESKPAFYSQFTDKELEERVYEEYLADKFNEWKRNIKTETSPVNKSIFRKFLDLILNFFKAMRRSPLEKLFMNIEKGKFKNSQVVANRFTNSVMVGVTEPALKAIQIGTRNIDNIDGKREAIPVYLSEQEGNVLSSTIAALYHKRMTEAGLNTHSDDILEQILDDYANLYDQRLNPYYNSDAFYDKYPTQVGYENALTKIRDRYDMFNNDELREILKDAVKVHTKIMGYKEKEYTDEEESREDDYGTRSTDNRKETYSIGGYGSMAKELRQYLSTIVEEVTDEFGNTAFVSRDGQITNEPLIQAANATVLYNGLLKAADGSITDEEVLEKFRIFAQYNPEANKFWNKFSKDVDLQYDEEGNFVDIGNKKQANLFQLVINGFQQHSVPYYFVNKDIGKKQSIIIEANLRGAAKNQFSIWYNAYLEKFINEYYQIEQTPENLNAFLKKKTKALEALVNLLNKGTYYTQEDLTTEIREIITEIKDELGITFSPLFIKYSYLKSIQLDSNNPADLEDIRTVNAFAHVDPMTEADARELLGVIKSLKNPFGNNLDPDKLFDADAKVKTLESHEAGEQVDAVPEDGDQSTDEDVTDDTEGAIGRLTKMAASNSVFDEQVATTSFKNGENEMVYSHQLPTFNLIRGRQLRRESFRKELQKDPFLKTNFLLNSPYFQAIADFFTIGRAESIKDSSLNKNDNGKLQENKTLNINQNKGVTYGSMSDREFILYLMELYSNNKTHVIPKANQSGLESFMTSGVLMGVIEASNTGDIANLPIIKAVKFEKNKVVLTDFAKQALYNEIVREYERIQRTQVEIDNGYPRGLIEGYHNGNPEKGGQRGLRFSYKMRGMVGNMVEELQENAKAGQPISSDQQAQLLANIEEYWLGDGGQIDGYMDDLVELDVLYKNAENELSNSLLSDWMSRGYRDDNGKPDVDKNNLANLNANSLRHNLAQVFLNNYINAISVNQLFSGDVAESMKDDEGKDEVKRNKVKNGSGANISSVITAPELGITHVNKTSHVVTFEDGMYKGLFAGKNKEKADGQMYMTVKALRYTLFGLGKLNAAQAEVLDKIERGESVSVKDVFGETFTDDNGRKSKRGGSIQFNAQTNSIKLLYADGQKIIKTSGILLTKELTSLRDGGARPGMEGLHKLRERLELFEKENETITFGIPKSASKGKKTNIASNVDSISDDNFIEHDNTFWKLQLENPSNKTLITDPTQAKQSIIAEQYRDLEVMFEGESMKLGDVIDNYLSDTEQRVKNNYFNARNEIFDIKGAFKELKKSLKQNEITPKLGKFLEKAVKTLNSTGADPQTIEFFTPLKDKTTGELSQVYDLNHPLTLDKFTQLFLAHFSKGVMSEKIPGHSLTLVSNWNMQVVKRVVELDENGQPKRWEVINRRQYEKDSRLLTEARNAKRWNNELDREFEGLQVGDLYIDDLRHNVPEYDEKGNIIGYFSEFMMPPHFREDMRMYNEDGTLSDAALKAFGVRIPSQDKHSAISLKLVDFLPAHYGSIGVFPHELIEISGADFDVDKLYMHVMDTYSKDGKRIPYGSAKTKEEKFAEYVMYLSKKDRAFKLKLREIQEATSVTYNDELDVYDVDDVDEDDSFAYGDINDLMHDLFSSKESAKSLAETNALIELGLPSTADEYAAFVKKHGEQNNGVLNNRILAAKLKLINNEGMVKAEKGNIPVAFQVAEVEPLLNAINKFIDEFPILNSILTERMVDVDSLRGMLRSFKNNKEGSRNIGPAVNSMLTASILNAFKIKLRTKDSKGNDLYVLNIDGKDFDSYEHNRAWDNEKQSYSGERAFYNISAIVSAMTDNAKERLAARLGLNINAIDVVSNMVALGVPLETALIFNLQPSVREFYKKISVTNKNIKTSFEQDIFKNEVGQKLLKELSDKRGEDNTPYKITTDLLSNNIKSNGGNANANYSIFESFLEFYNQTQYFSAVSQVLKLSKGLGTNNEAIDKIDEKEELLGLNSSDVEFSKSKIPFDLRQTLTGADISQPHHKITANYIRIKNEIKELQKSVMIEKTYMFKRIRESVLANLKVYSKEKERFEKELKRNIISYLGIKAYMQALKKSGKGEKLAGLTNALIYDAEAVQRGENFKDIIDTVREARELLKDSNDGKGNYFIQEFLNIVPVVMKDMAEDKYFVNPKNKGGINIVESNTWAKLGALEVNKLKDSFLEMYSNPKTRPLVYNLYNYLLVKDGGQFTSNSFIRFMPPVMFKELLDATHDAHELLKNDNLTGTDAAYQDVFGATALEIFNEFTTLYSTNRNSMFNIKEVYPKPYEKALAKIKKSDKLKGYLPKMFMSGDNKISIDLFRGIREAELQLLTDEDGREFMAEVKNTGRFDDLEIEKLQYNQDLLKAMNFNVIKREEDGKNRYYIEFPYTVKIDVGDDMTGKSFIYYKLSVVSKEKDSKTSPGIGNFILEVGDNTALATSAVYERFEPTGSKKQWKLGGLTGEMPTAVALRDRFGKKKKSIYDDIVPEDDLANIEAQLAFFDPESAPTYTDYAQDLARDYGIYPKVVDNVLSFYKVEKGKDVPYETTAKTVQELYEMKERESGIAPKPEKMSNPFAGMEDLGEIETEEQPKGVAEAAANFFKERMKQKGVQKEIDDLKDDNDSCII